MNDNNYNPNEIESKWYKKWECSGVFDSIPNKQKAFTITMPPPNVTGVLHMGHILNNTIQDAFIRYARMKNYNACWLPGMDHASIATENKVVSALQKKGIEKNDLSRTEFLKYVWDWKEKHGGIILKQLRYLGASCDWKRTKFTMDNDMSESVIDIFIDLYKKGVIYRGVRMVNWDSKAQTALSDEEVIYKETESTLYYIRYLIEGSNQFLEIATSRPETLLGDSAVCVNPNDQRYIHLRNKYVITPIIGRKIPIIFDDYVDSEFGSGVLKIKVCFTGLVRDKSKRKMSKSLGNSPDPIDLINKYGADGVRVGMLLCAPAGTDIIFDEQQCLQGRNFVNKLWNAYKLINSWTVDNNLQQPTYSQQAIEWFTNLISYTQLEIEHNIENCRMSDALHNVYELIWDNFCPYYLEIIKPVDSKKIDKTTMESTNIIFSAILKFAHLFIPFVTEEIWARMKYNSSGLLATSKWDCNPIYDKYIIDQSEQLKCIISKIRKFRTDYKISHKESLKLIIRSNQRTFKIDIIKKMCNLSLVEYTDELVENSYSFIEYSSEFFITGYINRQNENLLDNIIDRIEYFKGFISKIEEKLKNDSFINKAPESIIKREKQKLEDSKSQLLLLQEKMRTITNE